LRQVTWPEIAKQHEYITEMLTAGVTQATIHQRLRDEHGLTAWVASVKRSVAANLPEVRRDRVVVLRDDADTPPGEGPAGLRAPGLLDRPGVGEAAAGVSPLVLACSRHMFVRPVLTMDQRSFTEAHVEAFRFLPQLR
jgi:hypothetical protein